MNLHLERKTKADTSEVAPGIMLTPALDEAYWSYRVLLSEGQAIIGFPKFGVIGVGFAVEENWNTNLPSGVGADRIFNHIKHNKGDDRIADADVLAAIQMVLDAVAEDAA